MVNVNGGYCFVPLHALKGFTVLPCIVLRTLDPNCALSCQELRNASLTYVLQSNICIIDIRILLDVNLSVTGNE